MEKLFTTHFLGNNKTNQEGNIMRRLFVIGNGFDLHHGLSTSYNDFREYVLNTNPMVYSSILSILSSIYTEEELKEWRDIENKLSSLQKLDYESIFDDEIVSGATTDIEKSWYWYSPQCIASQYVDPLFQFQKLFDKWVNSIKIEGASPNPYIQFSAEDDFLTFNYTDTLQMLYGVTEERISYLHGKKEGERIFGYQHTWSDLPILPTIQVTEDEAEHGVEVDWRFEEAKESLNKIPDMFDKDCNYLISKYSKIFYNLERYDQIIFMGWSLGKQDESYMQVILSEIQDKNIKISVVYHLEDDLERYRDYFNKVGYDDSEVQYCTWESVEQVFK